MPSDGRPPRCATSRRLTPIGQPKAGSAISPKLVRSARGNRSGYTATKARSTRSGTISALMEPCRKNARSSADHAGTWAVSTSPAGRAAVAGRSPEVVQAVSSITSPMTTRARGTAVAVIPSILRAAPARGLQLFVQGGQHLAGEALELVELIVADEAHAEVGDAGLGIAAQRGDHHGSGAEAHGAAHVDAAA